jgi:carbon storage regulator
MLVLSRKPGERILIGNDITLEILRVAGNRVTLGITAPRSTAINREEVTQRVDFVPEEYLDAEAANDNHDGT